METPKYRLYAGRTTKVPEGVEYSLIPCGASYMLCFTDKPLKEPFREIPEGTKLAEQEAKWLLGCKVEVNSRYMQDHKDEITEGFNALLTELEKSLAEEQEKLKGEKKNADSENTD